MGKRIVAVNKITGSKYVTCKPTRNKKFSRVQTSHAYETGSSWLIANKNLITN